MGLILPSRSSNEYSKTTRLPRTQYLFSKGQSTITEEVHLQVFYTVLFLNRLSDLKLKALYLFFDKSSAFWPHNIRDSLKVFRVRSQRQVIDRGALSCFSASIAEYKSSWRVSSY